MLCSCMLGSLLCLFGIVLGVIIDTISTGLGPLLSKNASIVYTADGVPRWSEFDAPTPGTVVNVATELDVLVTVQYCIENNIPFLAQNGGHGWATMFNLTQNGLLINLRGIRGVTFNSQRTEATVQGGALISDVITAADSQDALVVTGNCNCVGALGAVLGEYGNLMGLYGFGVDNVLSLNVVTAAGISNIVDPINSDLWWALRGAGPNFGIVTSAVLKSHPVTPDQKMAWLGPLIFSADKIEALVQVYSNFVLQPQMSMFLYYVNSGTSTVTPTVLATVFYYGNETEGKAAFASLYAVGPLSDGTGMVSYAHWNDGADAYCSDGDRKPSYGAGFQNIVPATWRAVWNLYVAFLQNSGTESSYILLEAYSLIKARSLPDSSSSFPFRSTVNFNGVATAWYTHPSLVDSR